jgi:hypothetical protein
MYLDPNYMSDRVAFMVDKVTMERGSYEFFGFLY